MDYIGTTSFKMWGWMKSRAHEESFPMPQPEGSPYILLEKISDDQILALAGRFTKSKVELFIIEITKPEIRPEDRVSITFDEYDRACKSATDLQEKALLEKVHDSANPHTSSIPNQP